jgi:hypothetical protein
VPSGRMSVAIRSSANFGVKPRPQASRLFGTFLGGSGRYKGVTGSYEFSWRFLLEDKDGGTVQGQSMDLKGQVRAGGPSGAPRAGSPPL